MKISLNDLHMRAGYFYELYKTSNETLFLFEAICNYRCYVNLGGRKEFPAIDNLVKKLFKGFDEYQLKIAY